MPKKRGHGEHGFSYIKGKNTWRGVVDDGFWPNGKRRQRFVTDKNKEKARDKLDALIKSVAAGQTQADKNTTVSQWAERWLTDICEPTMTPNGLAAYESVTRKWVVGSIPIKRKVSEVKPSDIRLVLKKMADAGLKSASARKAYNCMNVMFEAARLERLCDRNVVQDVKAPTVDAGERGALSLEQADAIITESLTSKHGTLWLVALLGGLRQAERGGAQIDSLDFENNTYAVEWTLDEIVSKHGCKAVEGGWECGKKLGASCPQRQYKLPRAYKGRQLKGRLWLGPPKSGRSRVVPLPPRVMAELKKYIFERTPLPNPHGLIWRHDEDGSPFLPKEDEQMWRDLLYKVGIITKDQLVAGSNIPTGHCARHTTATLMMNLSIDTKIVGEIVGHQSERTTKIYQHVSSPAARDAADKLAAQFKQLEQ